MTEPKGVWIHRMGMATLPIGIAMAVVVGLRVALMVAGVAETNPLDIFVVLTLCPLAAFEIWSGREYRRNASPRTERRR